MSQASAMINRIGIAQGNLMQIGGDQYVKIPASSS